MDNLARIISHGFAIVVVILLGIGFIYRGELFPDLELPDFLVSESGKMADTGSRPGMPQPGKAVSTGTVAGEPDEVTTPASVAPAMETPVTLPEAGVDTHEPPPSDAIVASPAAGETAETGIVTGTAVETLNAPAGEVPSPAGETAETGIVTGTAVETLNAPAGEEPPPSPAAEVLESSENTNAVSGGVTGELSSTPSSEESPAQSRLEAPDSSVSAPPPAVAEESASETGLSPGTEPETVPPTPVAGDKLQSVTTSDEAQAVVTETADQGSTPVSAGEVQPEGGPSGQQVPSGSNTAVKPYELLAAAREAFWLHNYDDAEKNYQALTELEPQNPDGYGELGNMYFSQGRWEEAAAAYYAAGTRLVGEGRLDSARELVKVIRGLNGQQADELDKLITSAASTGNH